jgi:MoxR-like ATPase
MNLNGTEMLILRELAKGNKTSNELVDSPTITTDYQNIHKMCKRLEEKGLVRRTGGTRNITWILEDNGASLVLKDDKLILKSNGHSGVINNLPVIRNYDHDEMIPSNVNAFIDPKEITKKIEAIMFKTSAILLEGDCGIGKTHVVMSIAQENGYPVYHIQGTPDTRVEDLIGFPMQVGDNTIWVDGIVPKAILCSQKRKIILFIDEINRMETNVQSVFFPLLDHRCSCVIHERSGEILKGIKDNIAVIATANTGTGHYVNPLDRAFEDRFNIFKIDYLDQDSEAKLLHDVSGIYLDLCTKMVNLCATKIRGLVFDADQKLAKPLSTRALLSWGKMAMELYNSKVSTDPLMDAAEITVVNHYEGPDQTRVRQICENLRGASLDEEVEKKATESFRTPTEKKELKDMLGRLKERQKQRTAGNP